MNNPEEIKMTVEASGSSGFNPNVKQVVPTVKSADVIINAGVPNKPAEVNKTELDFKHKIDINFNALLSVRHKPSRLLRARVVRRS